MSRNNPASEELVKREALIRRFTENSPAVIYQFQMAPDGTFSFPFISGQVENILGIPAEKIMHDASTLLDLIHPDDVQRFQEKVLQSATNLEKYTDELHAELADKIVWIEAQSTPEEQPDGSIIWDGFLIDITARKQAEKLLMESEERFRGLFEEAPLGYQSLDANGCFIEANQAWLDLLGYKREEVIGKSFGDFLTDSFKEKFKKNFPKFKKAGEIKGIEFEMVKSDGSIIIVAIDGKIGHDVKGDFKQTHCVLHDITERRLIEKELRSSHELVTSLLDAVPDLLIVIDRDFRIKFTNARGHDLIQPADIEQCKTCYGRFKLLDSPCEDCSALPVFETGTIVEREMINPADGRTREVRAFPIFDPDGRVDLVVEYVRDITGRKQAEEARRKSEEQLNSIIRNVSDIIYRLDPEGKITFISDAIMQYGYTTDELIGSHVLDLVCPCDRDKALYRLNERRTGDRSTKSFEIRLRRKDQVCLDFEIKSEAISDLPVFLVDAAGVYESCGTKDKLFLGTQGLARDITERKRAEENIRTLVEMLDTAPGSITVHDADGRFLYANRMTFDLHGYEAAEFMALNLSDVDVPESTALVAERMQLIKEHGEASFEVSHFRKDGSTIPMEVFVKMVAWQGIPAMLSIATDITERKRAKDELQRSEKLLRTVMDTVPSYICAKDTNGRFLLVNQRLAEFYGTTVDAMTGILHGDICEDEEELKAMLAADREVIESGRPKLIPEESMQNPDGSKTYLETIKVPFSIFGDPAVLIMARDITERKQAEQALLESETRFQQLFDNMADGVAVYKAVDEGENFVFVNINRTGQSLSKISLENALGRRVTEVFPGVEPLGLLDVFRRVWRTGEPEHHPLKSYEDGRIKLWVENYVYRLPSGLIVAIYSDTSEIRFAEQALKESEAKMRSILENIDIGVALISPGMEILELNARMREWFPGIDLGQQPVCYRTFNSPPREDVCDYCPTVKTLQDGLIHESVSETPQGETVRNYRIISSPIFNEAGEVTSAIELVEDITDRKNAEKEREILQAQLHQAQKMESVGRLAGGVAHDFNNMLGVIIGQVEIAKLHMDPSQPLHEELEEIQKAAKRSADLTRQLLAFARKQTVTPRVLDLNESVAGMLKMLTRLIGEDIDLAWLPGENLWPVRIDPSQLDQILANLCVNSRDAIRDVGEIVIETANCSLDAGFFDSHVGCKPGEYVLLTVSDDGCGMDKETLANIFDPFFTTKGIGRGTGLGLATVYGIVKQNDGYIDVNSAPGKGTAFRIYLPRFVGKAAHEKQPAEAPSPRGGQETVLLVEDEPAILKLTGKMLELLGYRVLAASSPGMALRMGRIHAGEISLLISDVVMPEMNGRDLARDLLVLCPNLKSLFMSGYTADVIAHQGMLDKGVNFISKPFTIEELTAKVREVLDRD